MDLYLSVSLLGSTFATMPQPCPAHPAQAATSASTEKQSSRPAEGDGYLYEHLEEHDSLWLDFIADTGDGGWVILDGGSLGFCLRMTMNKYLDDRDQS